MSCCLIVDGQLTVEFMHLGQAFLLSTFWTMPNLKIAENLSFQPKNRWVFLEILSFSKVYWSKPLVIKAEILSFHWYWPEFLENLSFRRLWVFRKVDKKKACYSMYIEFLQNTSSDHLLRSHLSLENSYAQVLRAIIEGFYKKSVILLAFQWCQQFFKH